MTIANKPHNEEHWNFELSDGSFHSLGKYKEGFDDEGGLTYEGVQTEQEAIEILKLNFPTLES